ncbi:MAG: primosomal protein N' [Nitrospirae bacterium]|nr:primosomal protein N' [Nitrospirota bacterium]
MVVPRRLANAFTYVIPDRLRGRLYVGSRVRVPLGPTTVQGLIVSLSQTALWSGRRGTRPGRAPAFREISEVLDEGAGQDTDRNLLALAQQVADHYVAPLGQCLRLILPPAPLSRAAKQTPAVSSGASQQDETAWAGPDDPLSMLTERPAWWNGFLEALTRSAHAAFLSTGPAALRLPQLIDAMAAAQARGRTVLVITPDVSRALLILSKARVRWPQESVLLHGGLKAAEYSQAWHRIRAGDARIVIGTRSSVFAPLADLGLIWVEDEQDDLLKEEQAPYYHAREVAWMRARRQSCTLVLGSVSPSVETWQALTPSPPPAAASIAKPPQTSLHPAVRLVVLRCYPAGTLLTDPLVAAIRDTLARRTGVMLFVNRKGFASALLCRDCGTSLSCSACHISLTYYRQTARLLCRVCGSAAPLPDTCPACSSTKLEPIGTGTERLEDHVRRLFPEARIARLERDAASTELRTDAIRRLFAVRELDILIGTKLLFSGSPRPAVGLVGMVYADALLHRPDFRAAERTFHVVAQAIEAASGTEAGAVVIQTSLPTHHAFTALAAHEPSRFYDQELVFREALGYPPYARLIRLSIASPSEAAAQETAERWVDVIRRLQHKQETLRSVSVLGPIPASPPYFRKRHRWHLVVKSEAPDAASLAVRLSMEQMESGRRKSSLKLQIEVDPLDL